MIRVVILHRFLISANKSIWPWCCDAHGKTDMEAVKLIPDESPTCPVFDASWV